MAPRCPSCGLRRSHDGGNGEAPCVRLLQPPNFDAMRLPLKFGSAFRAVWPRKMRCTWLLWMLVIAACSSGDQNVSELAQGCVVNTDCQAPLVCAFRRCHTACEATRDCP